MNAAVRTFAATAPTATIWQGSDGSGSDRGERD